MRPSQRPMHAQHADRRHESAHFWANIITASCLIVLMLLLILAWLVSR